jgi:hypothetical protein
MKGTVDVPWTCDFSTRHCSPPLRRALAAVVTVPDSSGPVARVTVSGIAAREGHPVSMLVADAR